MVKSLDVLPVVDVRAVLEAEGTIWEELDHRQQQEALIRVWDMHALDGEGVIDLAGLGWDEEGAAPTEFRWIRITHDMGRHAHNMATFFLLEKSGELHDAYLAVPRKKKPANPFVVGTRPLRIDQGRKWGDAKGKMPQSIFGDPDNWGEDYHREVNHDPLKLSKQLANRGDVRRNDLVEVRRAPNSMAMQVKFNAGDKSAWIGGVCLGDMLHGLRRSMQAVPYALVKQAIHGKYGKG